MRQRAAIVIVLLALIGGVGTYYYFQASGGPREFQGWIEADFIFVSPDEVGRIVKLDVREGSKVEVGTPLFRLDDELQRAAVYENQAYVSNAKVDYARAQELLKKQVGSVKTFDDAKAALLSAEAKLNSAKTRLDRRERTSPVAGTIQEVYFRGGEMVEPGHPIVSILPPGNVKVRFFVPQDVVPKLHIGDPVQIHCDGCKKGLIGHVSFISATAEFTPPVIYSLEERARLVFRIEAIPEDPQDLRIGQPADVALERARVPDPTDHAEE
jgi:HlyD family secretion protein